MLQQPEPQDVPEVQVHLLPEQDCPEGHTLPHFPQLLLSELRFVQVVLPQRVVLLPHVKPQALSLHAGT